MEGDGMKHNCLVTGGAGFIGSHLVLELVRRGCRVKVLDNLSTGTLNNLKSVRNQIEFQATDLRSPGEWAGWLEGVDWVFHLGAVSSVPDSLREPMTTEAVNSSGTLAVLVAARRAGVGRVVFASSSAVYGNQALLPSTEDLCPRPASPYAVSKLSGENYGRVFWEVWGLPTVSLRFFNVFGSRQNPRSQYAAVVPRFVQAFLRGEAATIYGDGEQTRDFIYVGDVVAAMLAAAEAPGVEGEVFNIARGQSVSVRELWRAVRDVVGSGPQPKYAPLQPGEVRHSRAEVSAARERLGFSPRFSLEAGLTETVAWFRDQAEKA